MHGHQGMAVQLYPGCCRGSGRYNIPVACLPEAEGMQLPLSWFAHVATARSATLVQSPSRALGFVCFLTVQRGSGRQ